MTERCLLTRWALGEHPEIAIDIARFEGLKHAIAVQVASLNVEEKFDLVVANYEEFEETLQSLSVRYMVRRDLTWGRMSADRLLLNRRIVNLTSTARLYLDQAKHDLDSSLFPGAAELAGRAFSEQYDRTLGYRVLEALRNHLQHRSIPVRGISYPSRTEGSASGPLWSYGITLALDVDGLEAEGRFKASTLAELKGAGKEARDIIYFVRQYIEGLARAQAVIRKHIREVVQEADSRVQQAINEWVGAGHDLTGLAAVRMRADGTTSDHFSITANMASRRDELATANQSHAQLSRRFVTGARPEAAYAPFVPFEEA